MKWENDVYEVDDGWCIFCTNDQNRRREDEGRKEKVYMAGAGHSPCNGNANIVCENHLDNDAVKQGKISA